MDWKERMRQGAATPKAEFTPEELLEALEVANRIAGMDIEGMLEAKRTPLEKALAKADEELVASINRRRRAKPASAKREHWRTAKKKRKEIYHKVTKPRRQMRKAEQLRGGAKGYYQYLRTGWIKTGTKFTLSEEEFITHVWPHINGRLPMFLRYNPKEPVSLYNIYAVDVDNEKQVLFDGMELRLQQQGFTL